MADLGTEDGREFRELIRDITATAGEPNLGEFFPWLRVIDPRGIRCCYKILSDNILNLFDAFVKEQLEKRGTNSVVDYVVNYNDVLDAVIYVTQGSDGEDLIIAGVDTTTSIIEWAMAKLLRHPHKLKLCQRELEDVIGKGSQVEEEDID